MRDMSGLIEAITELCNPPFSVIVEMMLNEETQWLNLKDWETNQQRWGKDDQDRFIGSKDVVLPYEDVEKTVVPGASISKSKNIFLPLHFAIPKEEATEIMRRILAFSKQKGSVTVSVWPAYGVEGMSAYPAQVVKALPADERTMAQQTGLGGAIWAIDGQPISRMMTMPMPIGAEGEKLTERDKFLTWAGISDPELGDVGGQGGQWGKDQGGPPPEWLMKLAKVIDEVIRSGEVKVESSRMKGFQGEIIFSTPHGDSVLLLSKERSRAGYVFKKKMDLDGVPADYDVTVSKKMQEFQTSYSRKPRGVKRTGETEPMPQDYASMKDAIKKAKDQMKKSGEQIEAGEKRQPRLMLRDWLKQTENGYSLRRDFRAEDILRLLRGGVNYVDGLRLADPNVNIPVDEPREKLSTPEPETLETPEAEVPETPTIPGAEAFEDKLDWAMTEPLMESLDSFLSIIEKPWSVDEHGLFKYLATSGPTDIEDWVNALDTAVNSHGLGNRWTYSLVERTHEKLGSKIPLELRPIVIGMLEQIKAAPWPTDPQMDRPDEPSPDDGMGLSDGDTDEPKKPDFDDDYNPEADLR